MSRSFDSCWEVQRGDAVECLIYLATTRAEEVKLHRELQFNPETHKICFFFLSNNNSSYFHALLDYNVWCKILLLERLCMCLKEFTTNELYYVCSVTDLHVLSDLY